MTSSSPTPTAKSPRSPWPWPSSSAIRPPLRNCSAAWTNDSLPTVQRVDALQSLARQQRPELRGLLVMLLEQDAMRQPAIRAMAAFEEEKLSEALLNYYEEFSPAERLDAVQTLASRPDYGWALAEAIKRGDVPRRDIPAYVARQLRRVVGNGFVEIWGPIDALSADRAAGRCQVPRAPN